MYLDDAGAALFRVNFYELEGFAVEIGWPSGTLGTLGTLWIRLASKIRRIYWKAGTDWEFEVTVSDLEESLQ